jgi:hypothetical protein
MHISFQRMEFDDKGHWVIPVALQGSLVIVHDGSYMPHLNPDICAAAITLLCTTTMKLGTISICEKTNHLTASNYRGEILGGVLTGHILCTIDNLIKPAHGIAACYCDNLGVIHHANNILRSLPEKQQQADLLLSFRRLLASTQATWTYRHVQSHQDTTYSMDELTIPQRLNVLADAIAKATLIDCYHTNKFNTPEYPGESIRLYIDGHKVASSIKSALYRAWGSRSAKLLLNKRNIVRARHFHLVDWESLGRAMQKLPQMYRVWVTKHVSGFCGIHKHLVRMQSTESACCPCCGSKIETTRHITQCCDPGRTQMFEESTQELVSWMTQQCGLPELTTSLEVYLLHRGRHTMKTICDQFPTLQRFAQDHDRLGWENFIMGRISTTLFHLQSNYLQQIRSNLSMKSWSCQFIQKVLNITHRQWLYRNACIHIRLVENMTKLDHNKVKD